METIESEGKTVAEAVESALKKLGLRRDQVEVQILQEASSGFLGIGAKPARVKITEKRWGQPSIPSAPKPEAAKTRSRNAASEGKVEAHRAARNSHQAPAQRNAGETPKTSESRPAPQRRAVPAAQPGQAGTPSGGVPAAVPSKAGDSPIDPQAACAQASSILKETLELMLIADASVTASWDAQQERVRAEIEAPEAQRLVGRDSRTLESLQFLVTLMVSRRLNTPVAVQVDALGYWDKREKEILSEAQRGIDQVKSTGKPYRLAPMEAAMRRLVHRSLASHPDVVTSSEGDGAWRKVVIRPRKG